MGGFSELTDGDVIVAHRLEKNHIVGEEYILMSRAFHELSGDSS